MKLQFTKMHGLQNDFVFIDGRRLKSSLSQKAVRLLCDRRAGIGADQLLVLKKSRKADFGMVIYNADGGRVEMCGNGIRCLAKFVRDEGITRRNELTIETDAGIQRIWALSRNRFKVDMGKPITRGSAIPVRLSGRVINRRTRFNGHEFRITCLSMGNPHCVIFVEDFEKLSVAEVGPLIEKNSLFPRRTNVEFAKVLGPKRIQLKVWERGAGETMACGSGACATVVAAALNRLAERKVQVQLRGGTLEIDWNRTDGHVYMTGPAEVVFQGEIVV